MSRPGYFQEGMPHTRVQKLYNKSGVLIDDFSTTTRKFYSGGTLRFSLSPSAATLTANGAGILTGSAAMTLSSTTTLALTAGSSMAITAGSTIAITPTTTLTLNPTTSCSIAPGTSLSIAPTTSCTIAPTTTLAVSSGSGDIGLTPFTGAVAVIAPTGAASTKVFTNTQTLATTSGASVVTSGLIPAGAFLLGVSSRVTTLITGATSIKLGDGSDDDRFSSATSAVALNSTTSNADATADPTGWAAAAREVTVTANGSNFTAGAIRVTAHYALPVASSS